MSTYSITTVTFQRRALFRRTANAELLVKTIFGYREQGRFLLHGFAVMPEHLHVLLTPANGQTVERCVQCIKGGFSFAVREQFAGESLADRFSRASGSRFGGFPEPGRVRGQESAAARAAGSPVCPYKLLGSAGWHALGHLRSWSQIEKQHTPGVKPTMKP